MSSTHTDGQKRAQIQHQIKDFGAKARKNFVLTVTGCLAAVLVVVAAFAAVIITGSNGLFAIGVLLIPILAFTRKVWDRRCTFKLERKMLVDDLGELNNA